jgi:hypothetical protein
MPSQQRRAAGSSGQRAAPRGRQKPAWARLAPVYDVDGPRIRLGVGWFLIALPAIALATASTALLYAVTAGLAARQVVKAWKGEQWQADLAAGIAALPILAAIGGSGPAVGAVMVAGGAAVALGLCAPCAGLQGGVGRIAAAGVVLQATAPVAIAGAAMVVMRGDKALMGSALILFVLACAYEMGDFLVGSGSSNPFEGPMAGGAAVVVLGFPMALVLIQPFDVLGVAMLCVTAACCPVGQWIASAVLPRPDAYAPALRRIDTLLLLAPLWAIATGAL